MCTAAGGGETGSPSEDFPYKLVKISLVAAFRQIWLGDSPKMTVGLQAVLAR